MKSDRIQRVLRSGGKGGNLRVKGCNHNRANCSFLRFCEDSALCDPNCNCPSAYICSKLRVWHCVLHLTHTNTVTRVCLNNKLFCSLSLGHSSLVKANFTVLLLRWDISFPFCVDTFRRDCMSVRDIPRNQHRYCCSGIMNEAAVQTLSVLAKQAKPAICYPMRCFPTESCVYLLCQISSLKSAVTTDSRSTIMMQISFWQLWVDGSVVCLMFSESFSVIDRITSDRKSIILILICIRGIYKKQVCSC